MKDIYAQAAIVNLTDEELLELIGFLFEEQKRTDERMKADPKLQRMIEAVSEYKKEHYTDVKKAYRSRLKAARYLAQARNLTFKLPEAAREDTED